MERSLAFPFREVQRILYNYGGIIDTKVPDLMSKFREEFTIALTDEQVADLLVNAFECGSNYWYYDLACVDPAERYYRDEKHPEYDDSALDFWHGRAPLTDTGVTLRSDDVVFTLNRETINTGIVIFGEKCPKQLDDFLNEEWDAFTSDAFLQCCIFGEVILG